ncbi:MAG: hypothetical protein A3B73_05555 [Omnitrophica WOR_2 bacterium RIFCSPHIGHO2_02_FULL_63_39]|nr:MAG: hypothetical protein A3B73_05555 [Omnitrophica WOR_2 bacterium RIFCSPHIGHO2_02_FULL_63_39]OGX47224.1 MAG: hypothetical protein A3G88_07395 [Omnitrophica WOR_2 bacterium RIFCSPLOWO2_12_FULL_63_16]
MSLVTDSAHADVTTGLVAHWKLDENTGTTATDASGTGNDATLAASPGTPTWVSGRLGYALSADGTDDYASKASFSGNTGSGGTVAVWVKLDTLSGGTNVKGLVTVSNAHFRLFLDTNDKWRVIIKDTLLANVVDIYYGNTVATPTLGNWVHFCITWDTSVARFYVNGAETGSDSTVTTTYATLNGETVYLASDRLTASRYLDGALDDVRIYTRALTASDVRELVGNGPLAWWKFDENTGTSAADATGNGYTGTLAASPATPTWASGRLGYALSFDGTDDKVSLGNDALGNLGDNATVSAWVKLTGASDYQIISEYESGVCGDFYFRVSGGVLTVHDGGSSTVTGTATVNNGVWRHVVAVSETAGTTLYVDGALNVSSATDVDWRNSCTAQDVQIGNRKSTNQPFSGTLDEVRVYNRSLTASEVRQLYQGGGPDLGTDF